MSASSSQLRGFSDVGEALLSTQLEHNVYAFLTWGYLCKGGFFNVVVPSGTSSGTRDAWDGLSYRLRPVDEPNYDAGQVWQAFRQDWVWETGVDYDRQPIRVSGVQVNGVFYPSTTSGNYAHQVNYPLGRIVFSSGLPLSSTVTCEYSYRWTSVHVADVPWWRQIQFGSFRANDDFVSGSGVWAILGQNRVQLPAIVVEVTPTTRRRPYELGNKSAVVEQEVFLHVLAETPSDKKQIHDQLTYQWQDRLNLFDVNKLVYPLDQDGAWIGSGGTYPDWVKPPAEGGIAWRQMRVTDVGSFNQQSVSPLLYTSVRWTCEVDMP